ncbi:MAG: preprotein translocase subunit SecE [Christensenellaceae bacterium]|jgi:preprotein translocase subunit SecE|nr:preprotein translocase subunit SecE [Christensenellaceae bacterium]
MSEGKKLKKANKKAVEKKKELSFFEKVLNFFKRLPKLIVSPFKNTWRELKKVTWPSRENLFQYTGIVLAFMAFMGLVIGLLDLGASKLIARIIGS